MKKLYRIVAVSALSFAMVGPVLAQTAIPNLPESWKEVVQDKFFETGKLRNDGDLKTAWASMTPEQHAMVRADCKKMPGDMAKDSEMAKACAFVSGM